MITAYDQRPRCSCGITSHRLLPPFADLIIHNKSATIPSFGSSVIIQADNETRCLQASGSPPAIVLNRNCSQEDMPAQLFILWPNGTLQHEQSGFYLYVDALNAVQLVGNVASSPKPDAKGLWWVDLTGTVRPRHQPETCLDVTGDGTKLVVNRIDQSGASSTQKWGRQDRTFSEWDE